MDPPEEPWNKRGYPCRHWILFVMICLFVKSWYKGTLKFVKNSTKNIVARINIIFIKFYVLTDGDSWNGESIAIEKSWWFCRYISREVLKKQFFFFGKCFWFSWHFPRRFLRYFKFFSNNKLSQVNFVKRNPYYWLNKHAQWWAVWWRV